jgi:hypothetical protein
MYIGIFELAKVFKALLLWSYIGVWYLLALISQVESTYVEKWVDTFLGWHIAHLGDLPNYVQEGKKMYIHMYILVDSDDAC